MWEENSSLQITLLRRSRDKNSWSSHRTRKTLYSPRQCKKSCSSYGSALVTKISSGVKTGLNLPQSVSQFSLSVMSNSLWPPWTAACQASLSITNSWSLLKLGPLSRWCHPTLSSSVILFSSRLQSFPASGSFPMSQFFTSGGQSIGVSAST